MLGATIGDIVGSRFESRNYKALDFELFTSRSSYTDDTVCTAAVADWINKDCQEDLTQVLQNWCRRYRQSGYGRMFKRWIYAENPQPYGSNGNGSAMRVSSIAWAFDDLETVLNLAEQSAVITHNHPEGIKGAQAVAMTIFLARHGKSKEEIRQQISTKFGYQLNRSCDDIRPTYQFSVSCEGSVPEAIIAFLDSQDFEHTIRLAISLGGDSDTIAAIAGSIAEAYYQDIPPLMLQAAYQILPKEILRVLLSVKNSLWTTN